MAEKSDYDGGDPDLSLTRHPDGTYDFVIYCGGDDLRVHDLSAEQVRTAAQLIFDLVPAKSPREMNGED